MPYAPDPNPSIPLNITHTAGEIDDTVPVLNRVPWNPNVDRWILGVVAPDLVDTVTGWLADTLTPGLMVPSHYREIGMADDGRMFWWDPNLAGDGTLIGTVLRSREPAA